MRDTLSLISASACIGQSKEGTNLAPGWLKHKGLLPLLRDTFSKVNDIDELREVQNEKEDQLFSKHFPDKAHNFPSLARYNQQVSAVVEEELEQNQFVLTVGGDHSIALGTLSGVLNHNPDTKIIWVDAHADINTPKSSPTGNIHGMPLSFLMNLYSHPMTDEYLQWLPQLNPKNIIVIGARDIDKGEVELITKTGMTVYTSKEVKAFGIEKVMQEARKKLDPLNRESFHVSFDIDGLDPSCAPSTGTRVKGGLTLDEGQYILSYLRSSGRLNSMDLVEINPMLGDEEDLQITLDTTFSLLQSLKMRIPLKKRAENQTILSSNY